MKIGFIGLGIMGRPMALNLKQAGHDLIVPERTSLTTEIRAAAEVVADAKSVAAKSEVVIIMVPDTPTWKPFCSVRRSGRRAETGDAGDRHVLDQPDRDQGIRQEDQCSRLRLCGCAGVRGEVGAKQAA